MNPVRLAVERPHTVAVVALLIALFSYLALKEIPIQLKPAIEPPEVSVQTFYFGASPIEIEDQITNKLEEQLNTINDLRRITSSSNDGYSSITLEFVENVDKNRALLDVQQAVNLVTDLPDKTQIVGPVIALVSAAQNEQIMWISLGGDASVDDKYDMVKDVIEPRLTCICLGKTVAQPPEKLATFAFRPICHRLVATPMRPHGAGPGKRRPRASCRPYRSRRVNRNSRVARRPASPGACAFGRGRA